MNGKCVIKHDMLNCMELHVSAKAPMGNVPIKAKLIILNNYFKLNC